MRASRMLRVIGKWQREAERTEIRYLGSPEPVVIITEPRPHIGPRRATTESGETTP